MKQHFQDIEILDGIRANNNIVLRDLYSNWYPRLRRFVRRNSGSDEDARDLFQDVILAIYDKLSCADFEVDGHLKGYFFSLYKHMWLKRLRDEVKCVLCSSPEDFHVICPDSDIQIIVERKERYRLYQKYLQKLDEECKKLLEMFFCNKSFREIAEQMNFLSEEKARRRKFMCKEHLFKSIENDPKFKELFR
ncbi:MAG: sigma-70 family RNA polymerase sigma factor [Bacteroidetes bacterium]|nr:sigma-70 family RNA polymerase sigma factor [Bacteroidota bacterium]